MAANFRRPFALAVSARGLGGNPYIVPGKRSIGRPEQGFL